MKYSLLAICTALLLSSCAGTKIVHTDVATGATNPKAIYIRPFDITYCDYIGQHPGGLGNGPSAARSRPRNLPTISRSSWARSRPPWCSGTTKHPMSAGWSRGNFNSSTRGIRGSAGSSASMRGASHIKLHVRVIDLEAKNAPVDPKDRNAKRELTAGSGNVIYEFDVAGGSRLSGPAGTVYAPGPGYAVPFDFKNAADRISMALTPDPLRYGDRPVHGRPLKYLCNRPCARVSIGMETLVGFRGGK